ncbi:hypothetical protein OJAV_G00114270 [Oryzias javanicus]|uniref:Protein AF1q n=1 Tax=Oryzias javanicus TaxID=123683 RepID=A0A3S2MH96_ORYJA|nr:hypothetical protein OJAV_G00114270 [Oryzias javanicus]
MNVKQGVIYITGSASVHTRSFDVAAGPAASHQKNRHLTTKRIRTKERNLKYSDNLLDKKSDMMEKSNSQYDSFLFWRQPIPELDLSELEDLGLTNPQPVFTKDKPSKKWSQEDEAELTEFSSFNYWRAPLADVDALLADLNLLL